MQFDGIGLSGFGRHVSSVALVDERDLDGFAASGLHRCGQSLDLRAVLLTGRRGKHRQEVSERMYSSVDIRAASVVSPSGTAFWGRLQCPAVHNRRRWRRGHTPSQPEQLAQVVRHRFKNALGEPSLGLLVDGCAWRKVVRPIAPLIT